MSVPRVSSDSILSFLITYSQIVIYFSALIPIGTCASIFDYTVLTHALTLRTRYIVHKRLHHLKHSNKKYQREKFVKKTKQQELLLSVAKIALLALIFGIRVSIKFMRL